ncbi:DNA polymerase III, gamma subunit [Thiothrix caldifontis]|uniref:DNA polymerase III subunit gamma/tau n=2 Tax=Thiothrix caldifontis TaxID=525918 RepID=A0A1H4GRL7_9GAMM|nr:DNA polymerase III, gamma subunit [Thiothrix caldifontis]
MVGQAHVLRALMNALEGDDGQQRLHHAYLFTGTRGVGKTTLARIFAKCLNCETGVTAKPCGECRSCREIAEGRHVDLIEVDAASRTKVEDTRDLLDNVQYAPTRGRFKIYLIDEVHMLSGHSFNALLKTLEEPPPHVKFLFATTDPQKLPVTILSRCLQFNLKRMPVDMISGHLANVLEQENIPFSESALRLLARAADGSMRDALSLTDQAIVAGGGAVSEDEVQDMLGLLPHEHLLALLQAVADDDGARMLAMVEQMAQLTTDFTAAADGFIALLHSIAMQQVVPVDEADADIAQMAKLLSPADVQLYYQMALYGRRDLPLAPDPRGGFEMLLLRMLAFRLDDGKSQLRSTPVEKKKIVVEEKIPPSPPFSKGGTDEPLSQSLIPPFEKRGAGGISSSSNDWHTIYPQLNLSGMALPLAQHCLLESATDEQITLLLDESGATLQSESAEAQLAAALAKHYGRALKLNIKISALTEETPEKRALREAAEQQKAAEAAINNDPFVQQLQEAFGAVIVPGSIRPRTNAS